MELLEPLDGSSNLQALGIDFSWKRVNEAIGYELVVANDKEFGDIAYKAETDKKLKVIRKVLTDLFMQIEVASLKNTDLDYKPLINEINGVIDNYRELVNTRYTINKKKAAKQEEGLENPVEPTE